MRSNAACAARVRTALPVQQAAARKITGAKKTQRKYDTRPAVQQRDN